MRSRAGRRLALGSVLILAVGISACGDDDDSSSSTQAPTTAAAAATTSPAEETVPATDSSEVSSEETVTEESVTEESATEATEPATTEPASSFTLDEPVRFVVAIGLPGVDAAATKDGSDAAKFAVKTINEAGGIGGLPVELEIVDTPADPTGALTAVKLGYEKDPTVMFGLPISAQVAAAARTIDDEGIPFLHFGSVLDLERGRTGGSDWSFRVRTSQPTLASAQARFAIEELDATNVALSYLSTDFGNGAANAQRPVIDELGATLSADLPHAPDVTDLTADILAAKDSDVVIASDFPNDLSLWLKQSADNGLDIPVIGGGSTQVMVSNKLAEGDLLANLYGVDDCNVGGDEHTLEFAAAWADEYGYPASGTAALFYDSLFVAKQAIENAQSADPAAIRDALETVEFSGVCHDYTGNAETHDLSNSVSVAKFNTDGTTTPIAILEG